MIIMQFEMGMVQIFAPTGDFHSGWAGKSSKFKPLPLKKEEKKEKKKGKKEEKKRKKNKRKKKQNKEKNKKSTIHR